MDYDMNKEILERGRTNLILERIREMGEKEGKDEGGSTQRKDLLKRSYETIGKLTTGYI